MEELPLDGDQRNPSVQCTGSLLNPKAVGDRKSIVLQLNDPDAG